MNKQLKSAISRFDTIKKQDYLISPISQIDAEIIIELGEIIKKLGGDDVLHILKEYKFKKDEEIRDDLLQWNIDFNSNKEKSRKDGIIEDIINEQWPFFKIKEKTIRGWDIKSWEEIDELNDDGSYSWFILLNPLPDGFNLKNVPPYANEKIKFDSFENRKIVLDNLESYFQSKGVDILNLNEEDENREE